MPPAPPAGKTGYLKESHSDGKQVQRKKTRRIRECGCKTEKRKSLHRPRPARPGWIQQVDHEREGADFQEDEKVGTLGPDKVPIAPAFAR